MAADASIYSLIKPQAQVSGPLDQYGDALKLKSLMGAQGLQDLQMRHAQQGLDDEQAVRSAYQQSGGDPVKLRSLLQGGGNYKQLQALDKFNLDRTKTQGEIEKTKAETGKLGIETTVKAMDIHRNDLANINTPADAAQWVLAAYNNPHLSQLAQRAGSPQEAIGRIPTDPAGFAEWKQKNALGMTKFIELNKPNIHIQDVGGMSNIVSVPGLGGAPSVLSGTAKTQTPDSIASNITSRANNTATVGATIRGQNMTDARTRELTQATREAAASGKIPQGYRQLPDGNLEAIPGGPHDTKISDKAVEAKKILQAYATARDGLLDGLDGTDTGPLAGRIPASTSAQQIAEGGVAAMAPILKSIFRAAGEGTFTDKDQDLLMAMIPTRLDNADARATKLANIDRIISAKLGMPVPERVIKQASSGKIRNAPVGVLTANPDGSFNYGGKR
jgi:hypothetical protein